MLIAEIAGRYAGAGRRTLSAVSVAAVAGLALSIAVLIVVISVVNGFERELRDRVLGVVSHVDVYGRQPLTPQPSVLQALESQSGIAGAAHFVQDAALVVANGQVSGALVHGVDPTTYTRVSSLFDYVVGGSERERGVPLAAGAFDAVLGARLADRLGVSTGDAVTLVLPTGTVSPIGMLPRQRQFTVAGILRTQSELDQRAVYLHLADAQRLFRLGERVTGIQLKLSDLFAVGSAYSAVDPLFPLGDVVIRPWTRVHGNLYQAIATQKVTMFVLLSFLVGVAAFNLISGLVMVVEQRRNDVAVFRTLGSGTWTIVGVFLLLGMALGAIGVALGVVVGVLVALALPGAFTWLNAAADLDLMSQYFINYLPVEVLLADVLAIIGVSLGLTLLAVLFPAWRATRLQPAEVLAHE